ncbi:hypothetical protein AUP42_04375 [Thalassospira lucentensis]|uniref:Peptidase S1 domain-containing protein n=1 Tax=Thalassospira lucentensis TaxID=168935 RepID=A0A154L2G2_9PROT|nr:MULTISPECIES: hypothetical protein [Thalassospira]KZB62197.1 hypothetical protein AUP42_04375 [Thalassospira lucentensis]MCH2274953.1 S1 family peptidase [Thalassospira sp.]
MTRANFAQYRDFIRQTNQFDPLLERGEINGYSLGRKTVKGTDTGELAIVIFVNRKIAASQLALSHRIPNLVQHPASSGGTVDFITDVQEASFSRRPLTARERPATSGISIGHADITAGTLGGLMRDRRSGAVVILSNNHVLANSNDARPGDAILQPGIADGGHDPNDVIAGLARFVPIDFRDNAENRMDAAIAAPLEPATEYVRWHTQNIGPETPGKTRNLGDGDLGTAVHKTGRTTGHTKGSIQGLYATVQVNYGEAGNAVFVDQVIISQPLGQGDFSRGGDSGSLVYDDDNVCVGLLFAGSESTARDPGTTIITPIEVVMKELDLELIAPGAFPHDP